MSGSHEGHEGCTKDLEDERGLEHERRERNAKDTKGAWEVVNG